MAEAAAAQAPSTDTEKQSLLAVLQFLKKKNLKVKSMETIDSFRLECTVDCCFLICSKVTEILSVDMIIDLQIFIEHRISFLFQMLLVQYFSSLSLNDLSEMFLLL